jgi:hypothetical protein
MRGDAAGEERMRFSIDVADRLRENCQPAPPPLRGVEAGELAPLAPVAGAADRGAGAAARVGDKASPVRGRPLGGVTTTSRPAFTALPRGVADMAGS